MVLITDRRGSIKESGLMREVRYLSGKDYVVMPFGMPVYPAGVGILAVNLGATWSRPHQPA